MELNEIEYKIACNELNASQVFTQMKQHIPSSREPACYESTSRSCVLNAIDEMAKAVSSLEQSIELLPKDAGKPTIENLRMAINKMSESAAYLNPHMIKDALRDS